MSDSNKKEDVYTTRVTGEMVDELDAYTDSHPDSRSAALRDLLDLGLQAEEADVEPDELQKKVDDLNEELDRFKDYALAGSLVTMGVLLFIFSAALPSVGIVSSIGISAEVENFLTLLGVISLSAGYTGWAYTFFKPYLLSAYQSVRGLNESEPATR